MTLSPQSQTLILQLAAYIGLPLTAWLCYRTAGFIGKLPRKKKDGTERRQHRLILTSRFLFVLAGLVLLGWALFNLASAPRDYVQICVATGSALLLYPFLSNVLRLGFWGVVGFAAQLALAAAAAAAFLLAFVSVRDGGVPRVETLREYVSLLTWQVLALAAGIVFFPQLYRMMGGVKEFDLFGFKGRLQIEETEDAEDEAEQEVQQAVASEGAAEALQEAIAEQADSPLERYKTAMKVWSAVAYIIRDLAVENGSTLGHANQTSEQIPELLTKGVLNRRQADRAERLLDIRNGWRRNSSQPIDQAEFASFKRSSKRLGTELSRLITGKNAKADAPKPQIAEN